MMNFRLGLIVGLIWSMAPCAAFSQGTVNFNNRVASAGIDAPVFYPSMLGPRVDGPTFMAQLYAGPSAATLAPVGAAAPFRSGVGMGYWNPTPDAMRVIPTVLPGEIAFVKVVAWDTQFGATYEEFRRVSGNRFESTIFTVKTGGDGQPPSLPAPLVGLTSFAPVPEPSTLALAALGGLGVLISRRVTTKANPAKAGR